MNTRALNALAGVICAAQRQGRRTPMGIAQAIDAAQMLQSPETAAELAALRAEVAEVRALIASYGIYGGAVPATRALVTRADELVTENVQLRGSLREAADQVAERDDEIGKLSAQGAELATLRKRVAELEQQNTTGDDEQAAPCRCDEPDADPYACEADDCVGHFSELNPHGAGARPVDVASAEVSRTCQTCGWRTSVWHVDDGSAEAELHGHVTRAHRSSVAAGAGEPA